MRKRITAFLLTLALLLAAMPMALADTGASETWTGTIEGQTITGGTEDDPLVITVDG